METDARRFLAEHEAKARPLETEANLSWWRLNVTGDKKYEAEAAAKNAAHKKFFADPEAYRRVTAWLAGGAARDPQIARQLRLLANAFRAHQVEPKRIEEIAALETELELDYAAYRGVLRGERAPDNRIVEVLRSSTDNALRREAWEASKRVGAEVAPKVIRLARLRNQTAKDLGFRDFFAMSLELNELPEPRLFEILDALRRDTEAPFRALKKRLDRLLARRHGVTPTGMRPWHYHDRFFQEPPEVNGESLDRFFAGQDVQALTERFYDGIGFEVRDIASRSDLYEREGKCQHAFCTDIDGRGDIRVLCNLKQNEYWTSTNLHEFGHAVYDKHLGDLPWVLRKPAHMLSTEAVAIFFERFTCDPDFLATVVGVSPETAKALAPALQETFRVGRLIFLRWALVMVHFERAFYADPDRPDLSRLWWNLVEEFQSLHRPEGRDAPDWAAKIHIATAPVYYQNYILGNLMAGQLRADMRRRLSGGRIVGNPETGAYLRERMFSTGRLYDWDETIRRVTGDPLRSDCLVEELRTPAGDSLMG